MTLEPPSSPIPELERPRRKIRYKVQAVHPGQYLEQDNGIYLSITEDMLIKHGHTLGNRPLNICHGKVYVEGVGERELPPDAPFPANRTLDDFHYDQTSQALEGTIEIQEQLDEIIKSMGYGVSVEYYPEYDFFKGLALVADNPRDKQARIIPESRTEFIAATTEFITVNESSTYDDNHHTSGEEVKIANSHTNSNPSADAWMQRFSDLGVTDAYLSQMDSPAKKNLIWAAAYKAKADTERDWARKWNYLKIAAQHLTYALPGTKLKEMMMMQEMT